MCPKNKKNAVIDLIWSANHLEIESLLNLGTERLKETIDNNDVKQIRNVLSIKSDFTKDEEDIVSYNFKW